MRMSESSAKMARKPASSSRTSHWNERKSWPTMQSDSHKMRQAANAARETAVFQRGRKGAAAAARENSAPRIHTARSAASLELSQKTVGQYQYAELPNWR